MRRAKQSVGASAQRRPGRATASEHLSKRSSKDTRESDRDTGCPAKHTADRKASVVLKITKRHIGAQEMSRNEFSREVSRIEFSREHRSRHSTRVTQAGRISVTTKTLRKHAPDSRAHRAIANAARLHSDDTFCANWSENSRRSSNPRRGCACLYPLCVSVDFASDTSAHAVI